MKADQVFRGVNPLRASAGWMMVGSWLALVTACSGSIEQTDLDIAKAEAARRGAPAPAANPPAAAPAAATPRPTPAATPAPSSTPPAAMTPAPAAENPPASGDVSFAADVWPIFSAKCGPCHTGASIGAQDIGGADKEAAREDAIRVKARLESDIESGRMPPSGCGGPPGTSAACISEEEFDVIQDWLDADTPP